MSSLREIAHALGGEVSGPHAVVAPGPNHSRQDRSLSVSFDPSAPDGFLVYSHAGDDFRACRDHVCRALGIKHANGAHPEARKRPEPSKDDDHERIAAALRLWDESEDPRGAVCEFYLNGRALDLGDDIAVDVLRWHPGISALISLFRNIETDEPQAVSRTFISYDGRKLSRKFLGPVGGAAIKFDHVDGSNLAIGEGIETCLAARQFNGVPVWALGSCGAIASFLILPGIKTLSILRERDENGANDRASAVCAARWRAAGREVIDVWPSHDCNDMADELIQHIEKW